jgi:hypothetical protein
MPQKKPEQIYNECLEILLADGKVEHCLKAYPEHAGALRPMLIASQDLMKGLSGVQPPAGLQGRIRIQMAAAMEAKRSTATRPSAFAWVPQWAAAIAGVFIALIVGTSTLALSLNSQPDSILYPVKLTAEQARLTFTLSPGSKSGLRAELAETRAAEIAYLASTGNAGLIDGVVQTLELNLGVTTSDAGVLRLPGFGATAPAPMPATGPPPATPTPSPVPKAAAPMPTFPSLTSPGPTQATEDSGTRGILTSSEARSLAVLENALQSAGDPAVRAALQDAIERARRAYEEALKDGNIAP